MSSGDNNINAIGPIQNGQMPVLSGFLSSHKVQNYFGLERVSALQRLEIAAQRLDTSLAQSLEVLRQRQDLESMLSVAETPNDIDVIKKSLNNLSNKVLVIPSDFLEKRLLISAGFRQLYQERVQEVMNNEEVKGYVDAGTGDLFASQTVLNNSRNDTISIGSYEGVRDALWLEQRGIIRYQLAISIHLGLSITDSLKQKLEHLLHKSNIPFYAYSSTTTEPAAMKFDRFLTEFQDQYSC